MVSSSARQAKRTASTTRPAALVAAFAVVLGACSGGNAAAVPTIPMTTIPPPATTLPVTTTVAPPPPTTNRADCVVEVRSGESLGTIANRVGTVTVSELQEENGLSSEMVIHPGEELDICVGNGIDDLTGASDQAPDTETVIRQQTKLNELFAPYSIAELTVDGDPGTLTRQLLCTARLGLGLPVSSWYMAAGSQEEATLMAADGFSVPAGAATWGDRWILIDQTCQVLITGEGSDKIVDIFATSTGVDEYPTRNIDALLAHRFDPARDTGGWHDSETFPSAVDGPGNGNMYKPLYFNKGQAIHGARYVPALPRSHGCARTFPQDQDKILDWLGLDDVANPIWNTAQINVVVTVQGRFRPPN